MSEEERGVFYMKNDNRRTRENRRSSGAVLVLILSALFVALSIVLGKQLSFTAGPFRISFENLTILMAGIFIGPLAGAIAGGCADLIGCLLVGYSINPIVTAGAASVGLISGLVWRGLPHTGPKLRLAAAVGLAHVTGSMIIKSAGLYLYYGYPPALLLLRIPLYLVIGTLEGYIIYLLLRNKEISRQLERIRNQ